MMDGIQNKHGGCDFQSATLTRLGLHYQVKNVHCLTTFDLINMGEEFVFEDLFRFKGNLPLVLHRRLSILVEFYAAESTCLLVYLSTLTFFPLRMRVCFLYPLTESLPKMQTLYPIFSLTCMCVLF